MEYRGNIYGFSSGYGNCIRFRETYRKPYGNCFNAHVHRHLELIFITKGEYLLGTTDFEDLFHPGDVFIANSMEAHWGKCPFRPNTENTYCYLELDPAQLPQGLDDRLDRLAEQELTFSNKISAEEAQASGLYEYGLRLLQAKDAPEENRALERLGYAILTLQALMHHQKKASRAGKQELTLFMKELEEYLDQHYAEPLSLEQTAQHFGYEKSYFCRKFRREFGQSFIDYFQGVRMKKFLSHPALSQQTIAYCAREVGYSNYSYFYQVFKKNFRISPRTYLVRKSIRLPDYFMGLEQPEKV